jgi:hypothetical protein
MRHVTDEDLDQLEPLLEELRQYPELRERKRGTFSRGSHAFLHFHADEDAFYVDVKLENKFCRLAVTTPQEQADFLECVRQAVALAG